jgi:hypothetical protein
LTLLAVTSSFPSSLRNTSPIRNGHVPIMRPCSPSTHGLPACPRRH